MARISILMAVYNAAPYLRESINSVLSQTHTDWELLCVDDHSTDTSWEVLQRYAAADSRIRCWQQPCNQGQAVARNRALEQATGDIIMFLDSDDWLSSDALQHIDATFLAHPATGCVLLQCHYADGTVVTPYQQKDFDCLTGYAAFVKSLTWQIHGIYAVRRDIHLKYPYDATCRHYSDDNTTRLHYYASREVRQCPGIYYYRQRSTSVSHVVSISQLDYLRANLSMHRQLVQLGCSDDVVALYENSRWLNLLGVCIWYVRHRHCFSAAERRECIDVIRTTWKSIDYDMLQRKHTHKPGYYPFRGHWWLFRTEFELFARARILLHR